MADLILPDPRMEMPELFEPGVKPFGDVVIDWDHPLTMGLTHAFLMNKTGAIVNLTDGSLSPDSFGSGPNERLSASENGLVFEKTNGSTTQLTLDGSFDLVNTVGDLMTVNAAYKASDSSIDHCIIDKTKGAGAIAQDFLIWLDTSGGNLRLGLFAGAVTYSQYLSNFNGNLSWNSYSARTDLNSSTSCRASGFINGVKVINDVAIGSIAHQDASILSTFGTIVDAKVGVGKMEYLFIHSRALPDDEIKSISDHPYQFLIPA